MNNKPQQPSQATRLQLQLNLITPTHQISHQGDAPPPSPFPYQKQRKETKEKRVSRKKLLKDYH